jgi:hypothetical protein
MIVKKVDKNTRETADRGLQLVRQHPRYIGQRVLLLLVRGCSGTAQLRSQLS